MINTSSAGNVVPSGLEYKRLNPRQVAVTLLHLGGGQTVSILDATDEQFELYRRAIGLPVKEAGQGKQWSFDNRCRAINHALKYGLITVSDCPQPNTNNSEIVPDPNKNNSPSELFETSELATQAETAKPPIIQ